MRNDKNSEGQICWNRNRWKSEGVGCRSYHGSRMGTQTTVSQGITTILLSGSETSGQADCLSISSFYCGRVALAVCWLLSFMVLEKPPSHKFNAMNLRLKAATPSQEKVSHSFFCIRALETACMEIARCGKNGRSNQVVPCWGLRSEISIK